MRFIILLFLFTHKLQAQSSKTIMGLVVDSFQTAIPGASVQVYKDSILVKGGVTNQRGEFNLVAVFIGDYRIEVHSIEYQPIERTLQITDSNSIVNLGTIVLMPKETVELAAVKIISSDPVFQRKSDRFVFNFAKSNTVINGNSAWEVLSVTPLVTTNDMGSISVAGSNGIIIYINEKRLYLTGNGLQNYLKGIPSALVEKVEVMTTPSSKFDAEGNAAIINIVLKRDDKFGYNGNISVSVKQANNNTQNVGYNFTNRNKKFHLSGSTNIYVQRLKLASQINEIYYKEGEQIKSINSNIIQKLRPQVSFNNDLTLTYNLTAQKSLTAKIGYSKDKLNRNITGTAIHHLTDVSNPDSVYYSSTHNKENSDFFYWDIDYTHKFDSSAAHKLNFNISGFSYWEHRIGLTSSKLQHSIINSVADSINNSVNQNINNLSLKLDYEKNIFGNGRFEIGIKTSLIKTNNIYALNNIVANIIQKNNFTYSENINAYYALVNITLSPAVEIQGGGRIETANTKAITEGSDTIIARTNLRFFPTIFAKFSPDNLHQFSYAFTGRIQRPTFWDVNPFAYYITDRVFLLGNAFLSASVIQKQELSYTFKSHLTFQAAYNLTKHIISTATIPRADNKLYYQKGNFSNLKEYNLSIIYSGKLFNWWSIYVSATTGFRYYTGSINGYNVNQKSPFTTIEVFNNFNLSDKYKLFASLTLGNTFPHYTNNTLVQNRGQFTVSFRKSFETIDLGLTFVDLLKLSYDRYKTYYDHSKISEKNYYDARGVFLFATLRLGKSTIKKDYMQSGNEDEKGRIK